MCIEELPCAVPVVQPIFTKINDKFPIVPALLVDYMSNSLCVDVVDTLWKYIERKQKIIQFSSAESGVVDINQFELFTPFHIFMNLFCCRMNP
jgi:hypothetical protein